MLFHVSFLQVEMIIEVVVVEMVTRVGHQDHTVDEDVVVAHITMAGEVIVAMRGGILVMISPDGIQEPRMVMKAGAVSQEPKSKTHLAGKLFLVAGELVQAVVEMVGVVELMVVIIVVGAMELMVGPIVGILGGVLLARREIQHKGGGVLLEVEMAMVVTLVMEVVVEALTMRILSGGNNS